MAEDELLVLLAARLRSRGTTSSVATTVADLGLSSWAESDVNDALGAALDRGQLRCRGEERRWSLTPAGEAELAALLSADLNGRDRADVTASYEAFLPLNRQFLAACIRWQDGSKELSPLVLLVRDLGVVLDSLIDIRPRFGSYARRLARALSRASVESRWVDSPSVDSVHTIWFELHEHLLATLGRDRTSES